MEPLTPTASAALLQARVQRPRRSTPSHRRRSPATMPRPGTAAVAALLLLAALAPAALAIDNRGPEGPLKIGFDSEEEERVAKQILNAFTLMSLPENSTSHRVAAMAVDPAPPRNITPDHMARIMGTVLAAAAVDAQAITTLGDPTKFA